ncbi:hypothetical protein HCA69_12450 [Listeria grandensis]|uniref:Uncharacterized protein n=1 Tax=Listeria grandensis TaxID=1494963 RepID=A0A7X0Y5H8_9LIST|nr:hypothetical protein [Listeria grandensis]MBC1937183.1 hypothetical protein [Listeria grandensis]
MYRVLKDFTDLLGNGRVYREGDPFPAEGAEVSEARADELSGYQNRHREPLIVFVGERPAMQKGDEQDGEKQEVEAPTEFPKPLPGGYYELSDGNKVQGKAAAEQAEKDLMLS